MHNIIVILLIDGALIFVPYIFDKMFPNMPNWFAWILVIGLWVWSAWFLMTYIEPVPGFGEI